MNSVVHNSEESGLIAAILGGDTQLYSELIRPHRRNVHVMSLRYTRNPDDAKDIAQETYIRAFRNLRAFRGDSKFSTWLIRIAINEAKNRLRRNANIRTVSLDEIETVDASLAPGRLRDRRELPSEAVEREELRSMLQRAVEMLPQIYLQVFRLRDVEELSILDTANVLNITTALVKVRLHRARRMLRRTLEPQLKKVHVVKNTRRFN